MKSVPSTLQISKKYFEQIPTTPFQANQNLLRIFTIFNLFSYKVSLHCKISFITKILGGNPKKRSLYQVTYLILGLIEVQPIFELLLTFSVLSWYRISKQSLKRILRMLHLHLAKMSRLGACKYFFQYLLLSLLLTYNSYNFLQFSKNSEKSNCRF